MEEGDDRRKDRDIGGRGAGLERSKVDVTVVNGDEYILVTVHRFDGKAARQLGRRPLILVTSEGKGFWGLSSGAGRMGSARAGEVREASKAERQVNGRVLRVNVTPWRKVLRCPYAVARERGGNFRTRVGVKIP